MTLPELLMAIGIGSILFLGVAELAFYSGRTLAAMANYVDMDHRSQVTLDTMSRDIRQANRLISYSSTSLVFEDYDGSTLSFVYDADAQTLTRVKSGVGSSSKTLLTGCVVLNFSIFQRNPIGGTYDQHASATADTCKLVQLQWVCSRKILGIERNTESVQSAKVVIRKQ